MKLHELDYTDGKKYKVTKGASTFGLDIITVDGGDLFDEDGDDITENISLSRIIGLEFEEMTEYNTPISFMEAYNKVEGGKPHEYSYEPVGFGGGAKLYKHTGGDVLLVNRSAFDSIKLNRNWIRKKV